MKVFFWLCVTRMSKQHFYDIHLPKEDFHRSLHEMGFLHSTKVQNKPLPLPHLSLLPSLFIWLVTTICPHWSSKTPSSERLPTRRNLLSYPRCFEQKQPSGALTIWMEFSVIPERIQMERFIPVESFRKKGNAFRSISFFPLLLEFPKISVPFVHSYSVRLFTVILLRKNAKDLKDGGRFPKRLSLLCVSLLVGSVGGQHNCNPAGENELRFVVGTCVFLSHSSVLPSSYIVGKKCGCWLLVSLMKCGCCSS